MTAAEFAATREALHLPIAFLADRWGITRQSVQRWESGYRSIPKDIAESLRNLLQQRDNIINDQVKFIESHKDTEKVILVPKGSTAAFAPSIPRAFPPAFSRSIALAVSQRTGLPLDYQGGVSRACGDDSVETLLP